MRKITGAEATILGAVIGAVALIIAAIIAKEDRAAPESIPEVAPERRTPEESMALLNMSERELRKTRLANLAGQIVTADAALEQSALINAVATDETLILLFQTELSPKAFAAAFNDARSDWATNVACSMPSVFEAVELGATVKIRFLSDQRIAKKDYEIRSCN